MFRQFQGSQKFRNIISANINPLLHDVAKWLDTL